VGKGYVFGNELRTEKKRRQSALFGGTQGKKPSKVAAAILKLA